MKKKISLPSPAMVIAVVALFAALAGGAYAATKAPKNTVVSKSIKNGQVKSPDLAPGAVKAANLAAGSVGADQLAADSIGAAALAPNAVGPQALGPEAVGTAKLAANAVTAAKIADGAVATDEIATGAVGAEEFGTVFAVFSNSPATTDADGSSNGGAVAIAKATAKCPAGSQLLYGGSRWVDSSSSGTTDANVYVQEEYLDGLGDSWTVEGVVDFGAQGTIKLQSQAVCLAPSLGL